MVSSFILAMMIAGVVRDPAGHPISSATVHVAATTAQTASDGRFSVDVADGTYDVTVSHAGFKAASVWA